jgi:hypothetical protein
MKTPQKLEVYASVFPRDLILRYFSGGPIHTHELVLGLLGVGSASPSVIPELTPWARL